MKLLTPVTLSLLLSLSTAYSQSSSYEIYKLLAEQGDVDSQYNLGQMYAYGEGVTEDDAEAVKWVRLAAEQGYVRAQFNLGVMCAKGEGVPQDYLEAYVWLSVAAAQGHEMAETFKGRVAGALTSAQTARGKELAARCIESEYKNCD